MHWLIYFQLVTSLLYTSGNTVNMSWEKNQWLEFSEVILEVLIKFTGFFFLIEL